LYNSKAFCATCGAAFNPGAVAGLTIPGILNPVTGALLRELSSTAAIAKTARLIGLRERGDR